jgi:quercetin dioxygenase-like cupin family protein
MLSTSLLENLTYLENKPKVELLLETEFSKEIRIAFKAGQEMKEHKAPFPIIVEMFEGAITFGVGGKKHALKRGDMLTLSAKVPHDLLATEGSIVRLSLSKHDHTSRVENVSEK